MDEEISSSHVSSENELSNLHRGQAALDGVRDANAQSRNGVVGVLETVSMQFNRQI
jgi:hypothetical protein